ncbi:MAG: histidine kinase, partial [Leeuwenhoekiella sp.]
ELQYLKKQIHPHFLFNALNTIYGFALKKSDSTPEIILKLANLLDYILYQVQEKAVPLQQELDHIAEYISLEKMRFQDTLEVKFTQQAASETRMIPPMLFLPLVENAFKHGSIIDGKMRVDIHFEEKEEEIIFNISNSFKGIPAENKSGIGLENIRKRLDLLYPDRYKLTAGQQVQTFHANLKISLHD